jgi:hypothetical protein
MGMMHHGFELNVLKMDGKLSGMYGMKSVMRSMRFTILVNLLNLCNK